MNTGTINNNKHSGFADVAGTRETIDFLGLSTQEDVCTSRKEGPVPGTK
jgi:hypothetical protein